MPARAQYRCSPPPTITPPDSGHRVWRQRLSGPGRDRLCGEWFDAQHRQPLPGLHQLGSNNGQVSAQQTLTLYNGGNQPLTISSIVPSGGAGYTVEPATSNGCATNGITLAPGHHLPIPRHLHRSPRGHADGLGRHHQQLAQPARHSADKLRSPVTPAASGLRQRPIRMCSLLRQPEPPAYLCR
jgi:hypothetical protein